MKMKLDNLWTKILSKELGGVITRVEHARVLVYHSYFDRPMSNGQTSFLMWSQIETVAAWQLSRDSKQGMMSRWREGIERRTLGIYEFLILFLVCIKEISNNGERGSLDIRRCKAYMPTSAYTYTFRYIYMYIPMSYIYDA